MSYNPTFPPYDSGITGLYYAAANAPGSQQRTDSPSDAPHATDRDAFAAHVSPTPRNATPLSGSRHASVAPAGWPPTSKSSTPMSYPASDLAQFGALGSASLAPGASTAFAVDQSPLTPFSGLPSLLPGALSSHKPSGTPEVPNASLQGSLLSSAGAGLGAYPSTSSLRGANILNGPISRSATGTPSAATPATASVSSQAASVVPSAVQSPQGPAATPGFGAPDAVPPPLANWLYIDLSNAVQGPFSATQMSDWLPYFTDTVLMKRDSDDEFVPFGTIKEASGCPNPFVVPLSPDLWALLTRFAKSPAAPGVSAPGSAPGTGSGVSAKTVSNGGATSAIGTTPSSRLASASPEAAKLPTLDSSLADLKLSHTDSVARNELNPDSAAAFSAAAVTAGNENLHAPYTVLDESAFQMRPGQQSTTADKNFAVKGAKENEMTKERKEAFLKQQQHQKLSPISPSPQPHLVPARADPPIVEPWAKPSLPAVSLAELKQKEMEKQKKQSEHAGPRKVQAKNWTQLPLGDPTRSPSTPTSASSTSPARSDSQNTPSGWNRAHAQVSAPKSLAEIQKEAQAKKVQAKTTYSSVAAQSGNSSGPAPGSYQGRFSALSESTPESRAKHSSQPPAAAAAASRPARSAAVKSASVTAAANQAKPTDELIQWAKVSFKGLSKDVNPMELLDVFLSLPANNEAKEFIAESIYSYSKTLDGRRFAHDFLSRKKQAEQSMKPGETWQDVLKRFNPTVEQDPSFKVVTNKRVKPLARPESMRA